ncbi:MAG: MarR family winged helix-turn-helix transcriptional regulator [Kiloniellaceae bacterium]
MPKKQSPAGRQLTDLILEIFRLNGALLAAGDALVGDLGLTSARWQVLGAVALEGRPLTVPQIARRMGLSRQAVQRVANDLEAEGLLGWADNPDHKRARLVVLTPAGEKTYAEADARQVAWANGLARGLSAESLSAALDILQTLDARCRSADGDEPGKGG